MAITERVLDPTSPAPERVAELEQRIQSLERLIETQGHQIERLGLYIGELRRALRVTGAAFSAVGD
jgi:uncharacterized coiled-coil protein SlyX